LATYLGGKCKGFFSCVKNTKVFQSGHFVMGLAHVKNAKIFQNGEKFEDFSK
jgi:hypothetical protein